MMKNSEKSFEKVQIGTFLLGVHVEEMLDFPEDLVSQFSADTQSPSEVADSISLPKYTRKPLRNRMTSHLNRHKLRRVKSRSVISEPVEDTNELQIQNYSRFVFKPEACTKVMLERTGVKPNIAWRPFVDWPGNRLALPRFVAMLHKTPRVFELRSPRLDWPMEFLAPMRRLMLPSIDASSPDSENPTAQTRVVSSGVLIIHLIGARGLRAVPHVKDVSPRDENSSGKAASPETCAASIVAYHWAAKTLTAPPKPSSSKSTCNPDFLEEFEFTITNESPRFVNIIVKDDENQAGNAGITRSSHLGETIIDLAELPLEVTQRVELQLSKNTNEARLLLYVTITGLTTMLKDPPPITPPNNNEQALEGNLGPRNPSMSDLTSIGPGASSTEIESPHAESPTSMEMTFKNALESNSPRVNPRIPDNVRGLLLQHFVRSPARFPCNGKI
ncbi:unnamed protein product [Dibothriocephalus latus]|uniref:C2 domain-containing protein n=1 Tax=Dibothriocephalus latus TaxID=60516 RepID=A0A3P6V525_DIBLA|nr:unnamed protein product [Dibothriocephalus latus]